jgi:eukaryotic-like serine/threonine-protein kinase
VPADDHLFDDLADAILDGVPIDWADVESRADGHRRALLDRLRVLAALADVHRDQSPARPTQDEGRDDPPEATDERAAQGGRWGHLKLIELIGRGAFGQVYRARDTRLDRDVALKLLPTNGACSAMSASSIIEEGRLLARVRHPNVVTIHGAERIGDQIGLWMELVKGRTLEQILEQGKRFTVAEAVEIGIQLCRAISAVHNAGLLHRDIKSHNVMVAEDGRVVLMDFGTGRELGGDSAAGLAGSPLYLAPELLSGQESTVRSDIYSVGVLLYHLLTGSYPVRAQTLRDLRRAHTRQERTAVRTLRPDVAPRLARIIERAIDQVPERRHPSIQALHLDLAALTRHSRIARAAFGLGFPAAIVLIIFIAWEVGGRYVGSSTTPIALLAGVAGLHPAGVASVNPGGQPIIAVLPFENLSTEPDSGYLVDGLTDEIIRSLQVIQGLHGQVRSRASSFAFKGKPRNLREVSEQLGANLVVAGSVLRSGNSLRVNVQLLRVAGEVPLWVEQFDRELKDIFAVQDEISRAIVEKLRLTFGTGQRRYDLDIDTYLLYLKAREVLSRRGPQDAKAASDLFQQVVEKDPGFAPAYAGLAEAYGLLSFQTLSPGNVEAAIPLMQQAASTALELDQLLAEGHAAMGFIHARQYDWDNAQKSFRRAIDLNPGLTQTYINYWTTTLLPLEWLGEAEPLLQMAMRTDPRSPIVHHELGFLKLIGGRFDEAIDDYKRARELDADMPYVDQHLGRALTFAGRLPEALSLWESRMDPYGKGYYKDSLGGQPWIAAAYVMAGRRAEVERWAAVHDEPYRLALIHAALGNKDRTFQELNRAAVTVPHRVAELLAYPEMRLLRGDPRLAALRKMLRLP